MREHKMFDEHTPTKDLVFVIDKATELLIEASNLDKTEVRALLLDISEAERELTLREEDPR
jgi:hypothetical protein